GAVGGGTGAAFGLVGRGFEGPGLAVVEQHGLVNDAAELPVRLAVAHQGDAAGQDVGLDGRVLQVHTPGAAVHAGRRTTLDQGAVEPGLLWRGHAAVHAEAVEARRGRGPGLAAAART